MSSKSQFNTPQYYFKKWPHLHCNRFLWTNKPYSRAANKFYCSPRSSNGLLAILIKTLELEQWDNRNQEFSQWTNRKQRGSQRNSVVISPINVSSPICFHLNRMGNDNDNISSEEYFENSKTIRGICVLPERLIYAKTFRFYLKTPSLS